MMTDGVDVDTRARRLFLDEPDVTEKARKTFTEIDTCTYVPKYLGTSKHEFMECDCYEEYKEGKNVACGENSDCINRLTLIECVNGVGNHMCGTDCQNQRFQKKEYSQVSVFETKRKGYGVRADEDIEPHQFIYEYIGEVIPEVEFRERMLKYDEMGLKHFYFMMLQTGEFIDASMKGCIARFCNHSCNPNAYVNKWVVNGKLKMGIFANRYIKKGEEITFDYNVDRYGATAQPCYCEEPNCIGFLGGKTQTDAASLLPQNFADALGIRPSMEKKWINMMKSKGEKIIKNETNNINVEFVNSLELQPCTRTDDVNRVMSVLIQTDVPFIAEKLLERIVLTTDEALHYQFIKLHGYTVFSKLLSMFDSDTNIRFKILNFLKSLPKTTKNGIITSGIDKKVEQLKSNEPLSKICEELLEKWSNYETYKRITKRDINESGRMLDLRRIRLPMGWELIHENGKPVYYNAQNQTKLSKPPTDTSYLSQSTNGSAPFKTKSRSSTPLTGSRYSGSNNYVSPTYTQVQQKRQLSPEEFEKRKKSRLEWEKKELEQKKLLEQEALKAKLELENQKKNELERIIEEANKKKELEREEKLLRQKEEEEKRKQKKQQNLSNHMEMRWTKFFAQYVPNLIKKYENDVGKDLIKESARNIVKSLTSKELKKDSSRSPPSELKKDKRVKVKAFSNQYMESLIAKIKKKKSRNE